MIEVRFVRITKLAAVFPFAFNYTYWYPVATGSFEDLAVTLTLLWAAHVTCIR